jgi:hypothetical protein
VRAGELSSACRCSPLAADARLSSSDALDALFKRHDYCCRTSITEAHFMGLLAMLEAGAGCTCTILERIPRSGRHVMKSLYTVKALYGGLSGIMRIVDRGCTTSSCEAYVEAIGSKVNVHASALRGLDAETYSMEAWIDWNSCALHHADAWLTDALTIYFKDKDWHFKKTSKKGMESSSQLRFQSKVLHKMNAAPSKFGCMT